MTWHSELSPEAEKAQSEAAGRDAMFLPRLKRTNGLLIVQRPHWGTRGAFAELMAQRLPGFVFDTKRDRWSAELTMENYEAAMGRGPWKVSDGVKQWAEEREI